MPSDSALHCLPATDDTGLLWSQAKQGVGNLSSVVHTPHYGQRMVARPILAPVLWVTVPVAEMYSGSESQTLAGLVVRTRGLTVTGGTRWLSRDCAAQVAATRREHAISRCGGACYRLAKLS